MGLYVFVAAMATGVFLVLAARWLLVLRRAARDAHLHLRPVDKLLAAAPIGYTVLCFVAAGELGDRIAQMAGDASATDLLPLFGSLDRGAALWVAGLLAGLAVATPPIVVFTVEGHFASRMPELVALGRRAVWAALTGVRPPAARPALSPEQEQEAAWKRLLA